MSERKRRRRRRATTLCCASFNCTSFLSLFGFISSFSLYRLNVAIYLLYKFVIWFGIFDAMRAEAKEQQLEQEYENETRQNTDRRNRDRPKERWLQMPIHYFSYFFIALLASFEDIVSFALLYLTEGNPNSDKFHETPPDTPTGAKLCQ